MSEQPVVIVVGSLHYDIMVNAPNRPRKGETVTGHAWRPKFGGKGGNQAVSAARAGACVRMAGAVGDDEFGRFLLDALKASDVDATRVAKLPGTGSGMSVAISDSEGDYGAVIVSGANLKIDMALLTEADLWKDAKVLILQNEVPDAVNFAAAQAAREAGVIVCLNAAPFRALPDELAALLDVLVVNAIEAEGLCGRQVTDLESATAAARELATRFPSVVVTAGGAGVAGSRSGGALVSLEAQPVKLVSTHGAGDAFVGAFARSLAADVPFAESLSTANEAASRHVSSRSG